MPEKPSQTRKEVTIMCKIKPDKTSKEAFEITKNTSRPFGMPSRAEEVQAKLDNVVKVANEQTEVLDAVIAVLQAQLATSQQAEKKMRGALQAIIDVEDGNSSYVIATEALTDSKPSKGGMDRLTAIRRLCNPDHHRFECECVYCQIIEIVDSEKGKSGE
jgi:hypothetical protein